MAHRIGKAPHCSSDDIGNRTRTIDILRRIAHICGLRPHQLHVYHSRSPPHAHHGLAPPNRSSVRLRIGIVDRGRHALADLSQPIPRQRSYCCPQRTGQSRVPAGWRAGRKRRYLHIQRDSCEEHIMGLGHILQLGYKSKYTL